MEAYNYLDYIRDEMLDGKIVAMSLTPSYKHVSVAGNIYAFFRAYLKGKTCKPIMELDVYLSEKDRFVPDMMVVCDRKKIKSNGVYGAPDLVVEILSPSTSMKDKGYKKDLYEQHGVKEYWIVDPLGRNIDVYWLENGKFIIDNIYHSYPSDVLQDMFEEELEKIVTTFSPKLFPEMEILIDDVFEDID
jgi:Uma2 family endonuclease